MLKTGGSYNYHCALSVYSVIEVFNVAVAWLTKLLCIWEALGSNLNPETGHADRYSQSLQDNPGVVTQFRP
jgi:hypothetical protein